MPRIVYCHCAYARVIPPDVKAAVLKRLCESDAAFEAAADLCEMSARRDPALARLSDGDEPLKIAACYPRAVKWLFGAAGAPLPRDRTEVLNQRELDADAVVASLLSDEITPNLPPDADAADSKG